MELDEVISNFELLDDWSDRYGYIIELGESLPPMDASDKTAETKVDGCMSQVWMVASRRDGRLDIAADSDAHIVRGLIAILLAMYSGKTPEQILSIDAREAFVKLGLDKHLSPGRSNGLQSMVRRIQSFAAAERMTIP
jgi:cysteine desulfuration protein SufE